MHFEYTLQTANSDLLSWNGRDHLSQHEVRHRRLGTPGLRSNLRCRDQFPTESFKTPPSYYFTTSTPHVRSVFRIRHPKKHSCKFVQVRWIERVSVFTFFYKCGGTRTAGNKYWQACGHGFITGKA